MPAKHRIKKYIPGGIYHIYNRGIEGREVFRGEEDFNTFKTLLERYLTPVPPEEASRYKAERPYRRRQRKEMNLSGEIDLLAYCLLPDHFHLLVRQNSANGVTKLMRRVMTKYVMDYNQRYHKRGVLFESAFLASFISNTEQLLSMSKYIHNNPVKSSKRRYGIVQTMSFSSPEEYLYSSYPVYLGKAKEEWVRVGVIKEVFKTWGAKRWKSYEEYVYDSKVDAALELGELRLE